MKKLADRFAHVDEELLMRFRAKFKRGTFEGGDIESGFMLFGQICNNMEEIRYEMKGMMQTFQFNIEKDTYLVVFDNGTCTVYSGFLQAPSVIFYIAARTLLDIVTGNIHSSVAQMNGDIKYTGPRHDAIAFQNIFELFIDEFI